MPLELSRGQLSTTGHVLAQSAGHDCSRLGHARALDRRKQFRKRGLVKAPSKERSSEQRRTSCARAGHERTPRWRAVRISVPVAERKASHELRHAVYEARETPSDESRGIGPATGLVERQK